LDGCTSYGPVESREEIKVDNLFTETFTCDGWKVNTDRMAEGWCLNKLVNLN